MQVYAVDRDNKRIFIEAAERGIDYFCLECREKVRLRGGPHVQLHFYHLLGESACRLNGKSEEHIALQREIVNSCGEGEGKGKGGCQEEVLFPEIGRIADVVWYEKKIIFEVQCSPISAQEVRERNRDYQRVGFDVVWILHDKTFNKRKVTAAEATLEKHTHYFAYETTIYDVCDVRHQGRRVHHFLKRPIQIGQLKQVDKTMPLAGPKAILNRYATWRHSFGADLLQLAATHPEAFSEAIQCEDDLFKNELPTKKNPIVTFLKGVYHALIESSCH